jgi:hypothetical protein
VTEQSAYDPLRPARRPGGRPEDAPVYRVLVNKRFKRHYDQLVERVGVQQAQQFWDHVARSPGGHPPVAQSCILRGRAGRPMGDGWSRTIHYEVTGSARIDYQYHDKYRTYPDGDPHPVVAILTVSYSSH